MHPFPTGRRSTICPWRASWRASASGPPVWGAVHEGYYVVSENAGTPHSFTVGTLLPHVMRYNIVADPAPYAAIADIIGVGKTETDLFNAAAEAVADRVRDLGLLSGLKALGVKEEDIPELAKTAIHHDRLVRGNVRKMSEVDFVRLLTAAL